MAWSYSKDPMSSSLDTVRFLIGDIYENDPLLQNEEIQATISLNPNIYKAAAAACQAIAAAIHARRFDNKTGPVDYKESQAYEHYISLSKELLSKSKTSSSMKYMPTCNTHKPIFNVDMMDYK